MLLPQESFSFPRVLSRQFKHKSTFACPKRLKTPGLSESTHTCEQIQMYQYWNIRPKKTALYHWTESAAQTTAKQHDNYNYRSSCNVTDEVLESWTTADLIINMCVKRLTAYKIKICLCNVCVCTYYVYIYIKIHTYSIFKCIHLYS